MGARNGERAWHKQASLAALRNDRKRTGYDPYDSAPAQATRPARASTIPSVPHLFRRKKLSANYL